MLSSSFVCEEKAKEWVRKMKMAYAGSLDEAITQAKMLTEGREIVVIPDGVGIIVT